VQSTAVVLLIVLPYYTISVVPSLLQSWGAIYLDIQFQLLILKYNNFEISKSQYFTDTADDREEQHQQIPAEVKIKK
jgi:hypothetical protein